MREYLRRTSVGKQESNLRAQQLWEHQSVGGKRSAALPGTRQYFADLYRYRYGYEHPWIPDFFNFAGLSGKDVLEIGIGTGLDAVEMARWGARYTGVDVVENHLRLTKQNFAINLPAYEPRLIHGDLTATELRVRFDVVYSFGVLHHIAHEREYLHRIHDLLKPGGRLLVGLYANVSFFNAYMVARWLLELKCRRIPLSNWRSSVSEGSALEQPVVIRVRSRRDIEKLYREAGFEPRRYAKYGFVQNNLPLIGRACHPNGVVLRTLGRMLGWYHLFDFERVTGIPFAQGRSCDPQRWV